MLYNYNVHEVSISSDISLGSNMECFRIAECNSSEHMLTISSGLINKDGFINISNYMLYNDSLILLVDKRGRVCESLFSAVTSNSISIVCENGFELTDLMDLIVRPFIRCSLKKLDKAFVHASAFVMDNKAYLMTAWANTGKTGTVLSALYSGASYLGDDLCIIDKDGNIFSYPVPLNLFDYNLRDYPDLVKELSLSTRVKLRTSSYLSKFFDKLSKSQLIGKMSFFFYAGKLFFDNAAHVRLSAKSLGFNEYNGMIKLDKIILVERSDFQDSFKRDKNSAELIQNKMQSCINYEFKRFLDYEMSARWTGFYEKEYFTENFELDVYKAALDSTDSCYFDLLPKERDFKKYLKEVTK